MSFLCSETLSFSEMSGLRLTGVPSISKERQGGRVETGRKREPKDSELPHSPK